MSNTERLTTRQRFALGVLRNHGTLTRTRLGALLDTSPEGASQTAASLVNRQMVFRFKDGGETCYAITNHGMAQVNTNAGGQ